MSLYSTNSLFITEKHKLIFFMLILYVGKDINRLPSEHWGIQIR